MAKRKKITMKAAVKFNKDVQEFLTSVGATEEEDVLGYGMHLETVCGTLRLTVLKPESNAGSEIATIFTRFVNVKKASAKLGLKACNPYSGKWNFHEYTTEECLAEFIKQVSAILPSTQEATK